MSPTDVGMLLFVLLVILPAMVWAWRIAVLIKDIAVVVGVWLIQILNAAAQGRIR